MCVDENSNTPIVAIRFNDKNNGTLRLYDNLTVEVAAYTPGKTDRAVRPSITAQLKEAARRAEPPKEPDKAKHNKSHEDR